VAALSDRPEHSAHDMIREFWKVDKDDPTWRRWLHDGVVPNSAFPAKAVTANPQSAIGNRNRSPQSAIRNPQ
jgi:hypothetical protein